MFNPKDRFKHRYGRPFKFLFSEKSVTVPTGITNEECFLMSYFFNFHLKQITKYVHFYD